MFKKYLGDYYTFKISVKEMVEKEGVTPSTFNRWLRRNGYTSRQKWFSKINTGVHELDDVLHSRYIYLLKRCKYKRNDRYKNYKTMSYMPVYEFVQFCNENKITVKKLWNDYIKSGRKPKCAISLDRINNDVGYNLNNVEFVTHGFNSWKRSIFPIKVTHKNKVNYFLSKKDASLFYGLRHQAIGEVYNNSEYHVKGYVAEESTIDEVLSERRFSTLFEYYQHIEEFLD